MTVETDESTTTPEEAGETTTTVTAPEIGEIAKGVAEHLRNDLGRKKPGLEFAEPEAEPTGEPAPEPTGDEVLAENLRLKKELAQINNKEGADKAKSRILNSYDDDNPIKAFLSSVLEELPENSSEKSVHTNGRIYTKAYEAATESISAGLEERIQTAINKAEGAVEEAYGSAPTGQQTRNAPTTAEAKTKDAIVKTAERMRGTGRVQQRGS